MSSTNLERTVTLISTAETALEKLASDSELSKSQQSVAKHLSGLCSLLRTSVEKQQLASNGDSEHSE